MPGAVAAVAEVVRADAESVARGEVFVNGHSLASSAAKAKAGVMHVVVRAGLAAASSAIQIRIPRTDRMRMTQRRGGRFRVGDHVARVAAVVAAIGFAGIAIFQLALAAGAPWDTPRGAAQMRASQRRSEAQAQPQLSSMPLPR